MRRSGGMLHASVRSTLPNIETTRRPPEDDPSIHAHQIPGSTAGKATASVESRKDVDVPISGPQNHELAADTSFSMIQPLFAGESSFGGPTNSDHDMDWLLGNLSGHGTSDALLNWESDPSCLMRSRRLSSEMLRVLH
jgi:hypothetical protein